VDNNGKYQQSGAVIAFGVVYLVAGIAFPNPVVRNETQFKWRLAAWLICGVAFAIHIWLGIVHFQNSPKRTAFHASIFVALGAFALAASANIHALMVGTGNQRLLALALVIWPIMTGVPALVLAFVAAAVIIRVRANNKRGSD